MRSIRPSNRLPSGVTITAPSSPRVTIAAPPVRSCSAAAAAIAPARSAVSVDVACAASAAFSLTMAGPASSPASRVSKATRVRPARPW